MITVTELAHLCAHWTWRWILNTVTIQRAEIRDCHVPQLTVFCSVVGYYIESTSSVAPPKAYSFEIPCSRDWTRPVYAAVLVARYSVCLSVRVNLGVNGYDLIRSCFCFGTVSCERNCSKYQLIDEEAYVSAVQVPADRREAYVNAKPTPVCGYHM